ncbi:hypothetical protein CE91St56_51070 [Lachnospiraceae bacterium]|nr:hypothetical protein CE91St56_51070 [Lachnospiraceae bacterium]GKH44060.1 hypothetical protein CE91St57_50340 [Lachnospiraceae bacterium]
MYNYNNSKSISEQKCNKVHKKSIIPGCRNPLFLKNYNGKKGKSKGIPTNMGRQNSSQT